jgi:hypothetical protein
MYDLWLMKRHLEKFSPSNSIFLCHVILRQCSIFTFSFLLLLSDCTHTKKPRTFKHRNAVPETGSTGKNDTSKCRQKRKEKTRLSHILQNLALQIKVCSGICAPKIAAASTKPQLHAEVSCTFCSTQSYRAVECNFLVY